MLEDDDEAPTPHREGALCGGCGQEAARLRRGLCSACYARWARARPVGVGASCASCTDRRLVHLRHYELRGLWVVLCHNCSARAERVAPAVRSLDGLLLALKRDRRAGRERRAAVDTYWYYPAERRRQDRRTADQPIDATPLVIEIVADLPALDDERKDDGEPITGVHAKLSGAEL